MKLIEQDSELLWRELPEEDHLEENDETTNTNKAWGDEKRGGDWVIMTSQLLQHIMYNTFDISFPIYAFVLLFALCNVYFHQKKISNQPLSANSKDIV